MYSSKSIKKGQDHGQDFIKNNGFLHNSQLLYNAVFFPFFLIVSRFILEQFSRHKPKKMASLPE
ncbi:hypothetical protein UB32_18485 [Mesobacillus subterraneus]|uniref:Uncharacterized protein n=1 Tax=Mesobacillus subterraneus TaxID=285983 RepID=A0A0D6Z7K4_9BACI|nr:hypothetical protein UB32_18485 [Mesobacillus subterraneus]